MTKALLIALFGLLFTHAWGQHNDLKFEHIDIHQGLSNNQVRCVFQDSYGFLWIGTRDGLNKYDGYKFVVYRPDNQDSTSFLANEVLCMAEDSNKQLWIGTLTGGLFLYNRFLDNFKQFQYQKDKSNSLPNNNINAILPTQDGKLWIGTDKGLACLDNSQRISCFLEEKSIMALFQDNEKNLWIGTKREGLYVLKNKAADFIHFDSKNTQDFCGDFIASIQQDTKGNMILGSHSGLMFARLEQDKLEVTACFTQETHNLASSQSGFVFKDDDEKLWICENSSAGLNVLNYTYQGRLPILEEIRLYQHIPSNPYSLSSNRIRCVYKDRTGIYWIGTEMGLNKYVPLKQKFWHVHNYMMLDKNGLNNNEVRAFVEDENENVWLATYGGGLNSYSPKTGKVKTYPYPFPNKEALKSRQMIRTKDGLLWVTTSGGGLYVFDIRKEQYKKIFLHNPNAPKSLINNEIGAIYEDENQTLWIGTEQGLCKLSYSNRESGQFDDLRSISNDKLNTIIEDAQGRLWIATETNGIIRVNKDGTERKVFQHEANNPNSLPQNNIRLIYKDEQHRIWIGTGIGLCLYNRENESFTTFDNHTGFPNSVINGVLQTGDFLWISTNEGMLRFNPQSKSLSIYKETDGLQSDEFRKRSFYKGKSGKLYFGGLNGFNYFYPDQIKADSSKPSVVLTNFKIFNQEVKIQPQNSKLPQHISLAKVLELSYQDYVFSLEFAALHFHTPQRNQYAYRLENLEKNWNYVDATQRFATYTNLDAGTYYFKVKASNADGVWNEEETVLEIVIKPPFWKTSWFIVSILVVVIGSFVGFYKYRINQIETQKMTLELLVNERTEEIKSQRDFIEQKNIELNSALYELNLKNHKMTANIRYAQTIQHAILPTEKKMKKYFSDFFVLYRPKDIVSGDFYWIAKEEHQQTDYTFIAVADCTGHGVSGAFMSMISYSLLNEIVRQRKVLDPHKILEELDERLREVLTYDETTKEDGMDIALCRLEKSKNKTKIVFCGAKRPIYYIQNRALKELKGDRASIGGNSNRKKLFYNQEIILNEEDFIYLFSDGFTDQIDTNGYKIGSARFKEMSLEASELPLKKQQEYYEKVLNRCLYSNEQRDDITIIGIKI